MKTDKLTTQAIRLYRSLRIQLDGCRVCSQRKARLFSLTLRAFRRYERRLSHFFDFISAYPDCPSSDICGHFPNICDCLVKPDGVRRLSALPFGAMGQGATKHDD